tara:strand:- start:9238 stop:9735 length:498 start_codon:yes stop_codon:yes gene_type:complete
MKKLIFTLGTVFFLFTACEGPQGPPGFDGINILGQTFERTVNFQFNNQNGLQESLITIPTSIEVFESDAILVYRLEGQLPDNVDLWSLIPQNFFLDNGDIIQYVYNHTFFDIMLQIDGNFDLSTVPSNFTQNQTFRFVVVPSDFATRSGIDISDYNAVMNALNLD